jgi:hypothetical protein
METKSRVVRIVLGVFFGILLGVGVAFLVGFVVQALWNWLMPPIFGLPALTYWQAWGLLVLAHLLLGGGPRIHHRESRSSRRDRRRPHGDFREAMRNYFGKHHDTGTGEARTDEMKPGPETV